MKKSFKKNHKKMVLKLSLKCLKKKHILLSPMRSVQQSCSVVLRNSVQKCYCLNRKVGDYYNFN